MAQKAIMNRIIRNQNRKYKSEGKTNCKVFKNNNSSSLNKTKLILSV